MMSSKSIGNFLIVKILFVKKFINSMLLRVRGILGSTEL